MTLEAGDKVKMSQGLKDKLMNGCTVDQHVGPIFDDLGCINCSVEHIDEFGSCEGIVLAEKPFDDTDDIVDIRWQPSNLKYCYFIDDLERVS